MHRSSATTTLFTLVALVSVTSPEAATLNVDVEGISAANGKIGCALFAGAEGFPLEAAVATQRWLDAAGGAVRCVFDGLPAGTYAVAVSHDRNGNRRTDLNFLGIPKEDWGVSNNARPMLRAPTFAEASVTLGGSETRTIQVGLGR